MTDEQKKILQADLCARLPYGIIVKGKCKEYNDNNKLVTTKITGKITGYTHEEFAVDYTHLCNIDTIKSYLRPMSNMTDEENIELSKKYVFDIVGNKISIRYHREGYWDDDTECPTSEYIWLIDWLLKHHFDYRGLIGMGLALPTTNEMYNI